MGREAVVAENKTPLPASYYQTKESGDVEGVQYALGAGSAINAGNGDNKVEVFVAAGTAMASKSQIITGSGNDTISILGDEFSYPKKLIVDGEEKSYTSRTGQSTGLLGASINAGNGDNVITISAKYGMMSEKNSAGKVTAQASLKTGTGNDSVLIASSVATVSGTSYGVYRDLAIGMSDATYTDAGGDNTFAIGDTAGMGNGAIGMYNSTVKLGAGNDVVTITSGNPPRFSAFSLYGKNLLNVGAGNDSVFIQGDIEGTNSQNISTINLGAGNNTLGIEGNIVYASVLGGDGDDSISMLANPSYANLSNPNVTLGISDSTINLGNGDNALAIGGEIVRTLDKNTRIGTVRAEMESVTITAGKGKDNITINGELSFSSIKDSAGDANITIFSDTEDAISLGDSSISTGAGHDVITIDNSSGGIAVYNNSIITAGAGNDTVTIKGDVLAQGRSGVKAAINLGAGNNSLSIEGNVGFTRYYDNAALAWVEKPVAGGSVTVLGGAQSDTISITGTIIATSIDAGAGNDSVSIGQKLGAMTEVKGGKGTDTLNVSGLGMQVDETMYTLRGDTATVVGDAQTLSGFEVLDIGREDGKGTRLVITGADVTAMLKGEAAVSFTYNGKKKASLVIEGSDKDAYMLGLGWSSIGTTAWNGGSYNILEWSGGTAKKYVLISQDVAYEEMARISDANAASLTDGQACELYDISLTQALTKGLGSLKSTTLTLGDGADSLTVAAGEAAGADGKTEFSSINMGGGNDTLRLQSAKGTSIELGSGNNELAVNTSGTNLTISSGAGADSVTIADLANSTLDLGGGNNTLAIDSADSISIMLGAGSDSLALGNVQDTLVELGGGEDVLRIDDASNALTIRNTDGSTNLTIAGDKLQKDLSVSMGKGRDTLTVGSVDSAAILQNAYFHVGSPIPGSDGTFAEANKNVINMYLQKSATKDVVAAIAGNVAPANIQMQEQDGVNKYMNMQFGSTNEGEQSFLQDTDITFTTGENTLSVVGITKISDSHLKFDGASTVSMGMITTGNNNTPAIFDDDSTVYFDNVTLEFSSSGGAMYLQGADNFAHTLDVINGVKGSITLGSRNDVVSYSTGAGSSTINMGAGNDSVSLTKGTGTSAPQIFMGEGDDTINVNGMNSVHWATNGGTGTDWLIGMGGLGAELEGMGKKGLKLNGYLGSEIEYFDFSAGRNEGERFLLQFTGASVIQSSNASSFAYTVTLADGSTQTFNDNAARIIGKEGDSFVLDDNWTLLGTTAAITDADGKSRTYYVLQVTDQHSGENRRILLDTTTFREFTPDDVENIDNWSNGVYGKNITIAEVLESAIGMVRYSSITSTANSANASTIALLSFANVAVGDGNDSITISGTMDSSTISLGGGNNTLTMNDTIGLSFITSGDGNDSLAFDKDVWATINMGGGNNTLTALGYLGGVVTAGNGNDTITVTDALNASLDLGGGSNKVVATSVGYGSNIQGAQKVTVLDELTDGSITLQEGAGAAEISVAGNVGTSLSYNGSSYYDEAKKISLTSADDTVVVGTKGGNTYIGGTVFDLGAGENILKAYAQSANTSYFTVTGNVSEGSEILFGSFGKTKYTQSDGSETWALPSNITQITLDDVTLHDGFTLDFSGGGNAYNATNNLALGSNDGKYGNSARLVLGESISVAEKADGSAGAAVITGSVGRYDDTLDVSMHEGNITLKELLGDIDVKSFEQITLTGKSEGQGGYASESTAGRLTLTYEDVAGLEADAITEDATYTDFIGNSITIKASDANGSSTSTSIITVNGTFDSDRVFMASGDWNLVGTYKQYASNDYGYDVYVSKEDPTTYVKVQQLTEV